MPWFKIALMSREKREEARVIVRIMSSQSLILPSFLSLLHPGNLVCLLSGRRRLAAAGSRSTSIMQGWQGKGRKGGDEDDRL